MSQQLIQQSSNDIIFKEIKFGKVTFILSNHHYYPESLRLRPSDTTNKRNKSNKWKGEKEEAVEAEGQSSDKSWGMKPLICFSSLVMVIS